MIVSIFTNIILSLGFVVSVFCFLILMVVEARKGGLMGSRYVIVNTSLEIYQAQNEDDDDGYSEELRRLIGEDKSNQSTRKIVTTQTVIDLDEVLMIEQWTSSRYEDEKIVSDCTMIRFKGGDILLVQEPFNLVEQQFSKYVHEKSLL